MKNLVFASLVTALFASYAMADIARPSTPRPTPAAKVKEKRSIDTSLHISLVKTKTAKLKIPKSRLKQLRAQLDELDGAESNTAGAAPRITRMQTIVSGALLSLAIAFGGIWFARSGRSETKAARGLAIGAFLFLSGAVATAVLANVGPPPEARSITGKIFSDYVHQYMQASGDIELTTYDDGEYDRGILLEVPDPNGFPDRDEE